MKTLGLCLLLATGCATQKPIPTLGLRPLLPEPQPGLRLPEVTESYHLGRHTDPAHPDLLHEAHPVYRLEQPATWDLRPGGPGVTGKDPAFAPAPVDDATRAELSQQKQATSRVMQEATRLSLAVQTLQGLVTEMTRVAQDHAALATRLHLAEQRQKDFERDLEKLRLTPPSQPPSPLSSGPIRTPDGLTP